MHDLSDGENLALVRLVNRAIEDDLYLLSRQEELTV